jgi:hypothetical protein
MALSLGMNRQGPPEHLERSEGEHRRRLWWTVYIIDMKISINMGSPLNLRDDDIDIELPQSTDGGLQPSALSLHVKLMHLTGKVMAGECIL